MSPIETSSAHTVRTGPAMSLLQLREQECAKVAFSAALLIANRPRWFQLQKISI